MNADSRVSKAALAALLISVPVAAQARRGLASSGAVDSAFRARVECRGERPGRAIAKIICFGSRCGRQKGSFLRRAETDKVGLTRNAYKITMVKKRVVGAKLKVGAKGMARVLLSPT